MTFDEVLLFEKWGSDQLLKNHKESLEGIRSKIINYDHALNACLNGFLLARKSVSRKRKESNKKKALHKAKMNYLEFMLISQDYIKYLTLWNKIVGKYTLDSDCSDCSSVLTNYILKLQNILNDYNKINEVHS